MKLITQLLYLIILFINVISCQQQKGLFIDLEGKVINDTAKDMNTAPEIVEGIKSICLRVRSKAPMAKIVLMQIMPRGEMPDNPIRILINETNQILKKFAIENNITLLDITSEMLSSEGVLTKELTFDFCHPTDEGYKIWGEALLPFIDSINY